MVLPLYNNLMDTSGIFLFIIFSTLLLTHPFTCADTVWWDTMCSPALPCSQTGPVIQFPFWRRGQQPARCEYPGFELSCNNKNETILRLPYSGEFVVKDIDYTVLSILINDPDSCPTKRVENFTLLGSRFRPLRFRRYQFSNCSSNFTNRPGSLLYRAIPVSCLSDRNHTFYAVPSHIADQGMPSSCADLSSNDPRFSRWSTSDYWTSMNPRGDLELRWRDPRCRYCEAQGLRCIINYDNEVRCVSPEEDSENGIPRSAKYGIVIGIGIPALLLITGLACHICSRVRAYSIQRRLATELSAAITPQPAVIVTGLDGETIESYPKTVLGESRRLPKPSDNTCPICLSEYQPNETLRTIPDCNHYFHADCIDEWLKLNGTCPLCRNSPESLPVTPCSSMSSSTTTTTAS